MKYPNQVWNGTPNQGSWPGARPPHLHHCRRHGADQGDDQADNRFKVNFQQDKIIDWKLGTVGHNPTTTQYLIFHKFGRDLMQVNKQKWPLKEPSPFNA